MGFVLLPSRKELPSYYQIIKQPMDVKKLRDRIKQHKYRTISDMETDFNLMCHNARVYNIEESLIYQDSFILQNVFKEPKEKESKSRSSTPRSSKKKSRQPIESDEDTNDGHSDGGNEGSDMDYDEAPLSSYKKK